MVVAKRLSVEEESGNSKNTESNVTVGTVFVKEDFSGGAKAIKNFTNAG